MNRIAFLFPGQGSYVPGALAEITTEAVVRTVETLDAVAAECGARPVGRLLMYRSAPTSEQLLAEDPDILQPAIFVASIAVSNLLWHEYRLVPNFVFGHSFGEIAALVTAGFFSPEAGMRIVCARAEAFRATAVPHSGMLAIEVNAVRAQHLVDLLDDPNTSVAAENAPHQTVIAGPAARLRTIEDIAAALHMRTTPIRAPYGFHSPMVAHVAPAFRRAVPKLTTEPPHTRCWSDIAERYLHGDDDIAELLVRHLTRPVKFLTAIRALHRDGATTFIECGPRDVLARLVNQCVPDVRSVAALPRRLDRAALERLVAPTKVESANPISREPSHAPVELPPEKELLDQLRRMYSDATEYPYDLVTVDALLEADLGIDSLKQDEIFHQILARYRLTGHAGTAHAAQFSNLRDISEYLRTATG